MKITRSLIVLLFLAPGAFAADNAAKLALAHEVILIMKADHIFDPLAEQMKHGATQVTAELPAETPPEQRKKAEALQAKIVDVSMSAVQGMVARLDQIYADIFTEAELNAMKVFFSSPEGQSMLAKQSQIRTHVMPLMQQMQNDVLVKVQRLIDEAKVAK